MTACYLKADKDRIIFYYKYNYLHHLYSKSDVANFFIYRFNIQIKLHSLYIWTRIYKGNAILFVYMYAII